MSAPEIGKQWALTASGVAPYLIALALFGLLFAPGYDAKLTAVIAAVTLYLIVVGSAFMLGLLIGTTGGKLEGGDETEDAATRLRRSMKPPTTESLADRRRASPGRGFGGKPISTSSLRTNPVQTATPTRPPRFGLLSEVDVPTGVFIAAAVIFVVTVAVYAGPFVWNVAVEQLHLALVGFSNFWA